MILSLTNSADLQEQSGSHVKLLIPSHDPAKEIRRPHFRENFGLYLAIFPQLILPITPSLVICSVKLGVLTLGDPELKRGGVTSNIYPEVLEDELLILWKLGFIFMQDNTSIHTALKIKKCVYSEGIDSIERVWKRQKEDSKG